MISKTQLIQTIEGMPEEFSMDDFLDRILLLQKIELGINQSENNETFSTEEAKDQLKKWLK
ncbi:MAG: hypothetical protein IE931_13095 [Sphingobacteriales bacterium]|nr:hypothetical protein [Sphingobacteriales bacterium]